MIRHRSLPRSAAGAPIPNLWVNQDPALRFEDPTLGSLLAYWERKRGGRIMPARRDIDPTEFREHLGDVCLIDVERDPLRMRYRLVGSSITARMGRDATGRYYDEVYPADVLPSFQAAFQWIVANRKPLRCYGRSCYPDKHVYRYEILNMPLSQDGEMVDMVLGKLVLRLGAV